MTKPLQHKEVPWDEPVEILVWLVAVVITTFIVHNVMRTYKEHRS